MQPISGDVFTIPLPYERGKFPYYKYPGNGLNYNANNNGISNNNNNNNNTTSEVYYIPLVNNTNNNNNNNNSSKNRTIRFRNTVKVKPYKLMNNYKNYILQRYEEDPTNPHTLAIMDKMYNAKSRYIRGTYKPEGTRKRSGENRNARTARRGKYSKNAVVPQHVLNRSNMSAMVAHEYAKIVSRLNLNNSNIVSNIDTITKKINEMDYPANIDLGLKIHIYNKYRKALTLNERNTYKKYIRSEKARLSAYGE